MLSYSVRSPDPRSKSTVSSLNYTTAPDGQGKVVHYSLT